jgi:hypothetical protein
MVFVGSSVNAVRTENKKKISDVIDILLFLNEFIENQAYSIKTIDNILKGYSGISLNEAKLFEKHLAFLDIDRIFFELQRFKNEMNWYNLTISKDAICKFIEKNNWYTLKIPEKFCITS